MVLDTIDHVTLSRLVAANAVSSAHIIGQAGGWGIVIKYGVTERALAAKRGSMRIFRKFETLVAYLKTMGVFKYEVDATGFDPAALKNTHRAEIASARMTATHDAAAYDKWFREQVQAAIEDPRSSISNEEVTAHFAARRKEIEQRINSSR
ncbi:MAG: hypothetical protein A2342_01820 [Gallionellales bacterium RIFOXYB12_FULL_54_9]|nr:MAG: hypothetical protein A2342_01820 [Gallionellales bacterium RIFOXYB12_FULL_54_9]